MGDGILKSILDFVRGGSAAGVNAQDVARACGVTPEEADEALAVLAWRGALNALGAGRFAHVSARRMPGQSYVSGISRAPIRRLMAAR